MTANETVKNLSIILRELDVETRQTLADQIIREPWNWTKSNSVAYAAGAKMLADAYNRMDTRATSKNRLAAIKRIYRRCPSSRPSMQGIFTYENWYVLCDGYRLIRLQEDLVSIPHVTGGALDVKKVMEDPIKLEGGKTLSVPNLTELKILKASSDQTTVTRALINDFVCVNLQYLIDMMEALPGCIMYQPDTPINPIYMKASNGDDGILLPLRRSELQKEIKI